MDKNDVEIPKKKGGSNRIVASLLVSAALFMADLYVMITRPGKYSIVVVLTLLLLVGIYFFINAVLQELNANKEITEEQYENSFKSGKASYLLLKKVLEQIEEIEEKRQPAVSTQDIITAQKAIAKVTISRNKENADALMNSNDKVLEKIFDFEERLGAIQEEMLGEQKNIIDDSMRELAEKQQELALGVSELGEYLKSNLVMSNTDNSDNSVELSVKELEASLRSELNQIQNTINVLQENVTASIQKLAEEMSRFDAMAVKTPTMAEEPLLVEEPIVTEESVVEEEAIFDSLDLDGNEELLATEPTFESFDLGESENLLEEPTFEGLDLGESENLLEEPTFEGLDLGESENLLEEEPSFEGLDLGESENLLEEPSFEGLDLGESENLLEEPSLEELDLGESENLLEEPSFDSIDLGESENLLEEPSFDSIDLGESENLLEEPSFDSIDLGESENLLEESTFDGLDLDEPSLDGLDVDLEDISLEEEKQLEEPTKAEPVKVDLSNPNKLMTPDEIAALIASM